MMARLYDKTPLPRSGGNAQDIPVIGGMPCLAFVNTTRHDNAPDPEDQLAPGYANLLDWAVAAGVIAPEHAEVGARLAARDPRVAAAVRRRAIVLREAIYAVAVALITRETLPQDSLAALDEEVRAAREREHLVDVDGEIRWRSGPEPALDSILHEIARSAAELLTSDRVDRIRQCAAPECQKLFLDTSRNGSRRFCSSTTCGSLVRVRRFRERQRQTHEGT